MRRLQREDSDRETHHRTEEKEVKEESDSIINDKRLPQQPFIVYMNLRVRALTGNHTAMKPTASTVTNTTATSRRLTATG